VSDDWVDISGDTMAGNLRFNNSHDITYGEYDYDEIKFGLSTSFTAGHKYDIHQETAVVMDNSDNSTESTFDITVSYYDGNDTSGTLIASETQNNITISGNDARAYYFLNDPIYLDGGSYYIEIEINFDSGNAQFDFAEEQLYGHNINIGETQESAFFVGGSHRGRLMEVRQTSEHIVATNGGFHVEQQSNPSAPGSGAVVYVDSTGDLVVKFANGTTTTLASN